MPSFLSRTFSFAAAPAPSTPAASSAGSASNESFIVRLVFAPVLFVSFIVSLLIVDNRTSASILQPESRRERSSSPDEDVRPDGEGKTSNSNGSNNISSRPDGQGGRKRSGDSGRYYHSHQKKLMRLEMDEAFAMRWKVIVVFSTVAAVAASGAGWVGMKVWGRYWGAP